MRSRAPAGRPRSPRRAARQGAAAAFSRVAVERRLAQPAVRAVADVETDQLVAAPARPEVFGRSKQGGVGRGERKRPGDGLELFAGLAVAVDAVGLGVDEGLAARRGD